MVVLVLNRSKFLNQTWAPQKSKTQKGNTTTWNVSKCFFYCNKIFCLLFFLKKFNKFIQFDQNQ